MREIKILAFEDDVQSIKGAFDFANMLEFDNKLILKFVPKSQDINFEDLNSYDAIFVDIALAAKTELDGYALLKYIIENNLVDSRKVRVMTGNSRVEEMMENNSIPKGTFKVVQKPVDFQIISKNIKDILQDTAP